MQVIEFIQKYEFILNIITKDQDDIGQKNENWSLSVLIQYDRLENISYVQKGTSLRCTSCNTLASQIYTLGICTRVFQNDEESQACNDIHQNEVQAAYG